MNSDHEASKNMDDAFAVNETEYVLYYKPLYERLFKPELLIQTVIVLPFHMPLEEGFSFSIEGRNSIYTYHFTTVAFDLPAHLGFAHAQSPIVTYYKSRVEMIFVSKKALDRSKEDIFSNCFDILLDHLNRFLMAYLVMKKDTEIYRVSREMLPTTTLMRVVTPEPWKEEQQLLFLLHFDTPYRKTTLEHEEQIKLLEFTPFLHDRWNSIVLSEELVVSAIRCLKEGKYREAVMYAQTSTETLLDGLYKYLLVDEGNTPEQADKILEKSAFMPTVRNEYQRRIGGNWDVNSTRTVLGAWKKDTYSLRNRVVHEGYYPKYREANKAISRANRLRGYISALVKKKKRKYPETYKRFYL